MLNFRSDAHIAKRRAEESVSSIHRNRDLMPWTHIWRSNGLERHKLIGNLKLTSLWISTLWAKESRLYIKKEIEIWRRDDRGKKKQETLTLDLLFSCSRKKNSIKESWSQMSKLHNRCGIKWRRDCTSWSQREKKRGYSELPQWMTNDLKTVSARFRQIGTDELRLEDSVNFNHKCRIE